MRDNRRKNHLNTMEICGKNAANFAVSPYHFSIYLAQVVYALKSIFLKTFHPHLKT
jgi:hypothetical protein